MAKRTKKVREVKGISLADLPKLKAYIDRIGAEQLNFKAFMVKEHKGKYYHEKSFIRINADGSIFSTNEEFAPTDIEAGEIAIEIIANAHKFPKPIHANKAKLRELESLVGSDRMFVLYDRSKSADAGNIKMVQVRKNNKDGTKNYIPWTFFSDNEWRAMEPDGALPFFKPEKQTHNRIMVHEGAKAAHAAANVPKSHPWFEELSQYEHWGIIGGALAPHRADYAELAKEQPIEVVYVCDNDDPGRSVLQEFSRHWERSLKGITFGNNFPASWDMADPIPKAFFKGRKYIGPKLLSLANPATRATVLVEGEKGKKKAVLTRAFKEEWCHTVQPEYFINKLWSGRMYNAAAFNSLVRPHSNLGNTAGLVIAENATKALRPDYNPSEKPGYISTKDGPVINTYTPSDIKPNGGDYSLFIDYMEGLLPDAADREHVYKWCATLINNPEVRMTYSLLLVSEGHGMGKTTLGEKILAPLVGPSNCSYPREKDIVESAFNEWIVRKRLIVVNEIYAGNSSKAYNELKSVVADTEIQVNEKFQPTYTLKNYAHVIASSNSLRALKIDPEDRRWMVPRITEEMRGAEFWTRLNEWLAEDGLGAIAQWAKDYVEKNGAVKSGAHAPKSKMKEEVILEGLSPGQILVMKVLDQARQKYPGERIVFIDTDFVELIKNEIHGGRPNGMLEKPSTIRKIAKNEGWFFGSQSKGCKNWGMSGLGSRLICNMIVDARGTAKDAYDNGAKLLKPTDFLQL